jgi:hypothetical protein
MRIGAIKPSISAIAVPLRDPAHCPRDCLDRSAGGPTEGAELDLRFKSLVPGYLDIPRI